MLRISLALFVAFASGCVLNHTESIAIPPPEGAITTNDDFYVVCIGEAPEIDAATWRLQIDGAVNRTAELSLADLEALGARDRMQTLACAGANPGWPWIGNAIWGGRPLHEILAALGVTVSSSTIEMQVSAADGYYAHSPIDSVSDPEIWLVWEMNGEPLPVEHGYPARLLVSGYIGSKSVKWPTRITFSTEHANDYYDIEYPEYVTDIRYRPICFFDNPAPDAEVAQGPVTLEGNAFCGASEIVRVEWSADSDTWNDAEITFAGPPDVWSLWRATWTPSRSGAHTLLVRTECADGRRSDPNSDPFIMWDGYGWVDVTVR